MDNYQQLPQLETYNKVDQKIKEALDLDLNDRSGLKRGTGAPIVIHNRQHEKKREVDYGKYINQVGVTRPYDNLKEKTGNHTSYLQVGCF